jgi:NADH-quinone oxidoreductase subunit M
VAFDPTSAAFQFEEKHAWIPEFGIQYYIGVDGISLLLIVLTGFLTPIALLSSWESVQRGVKSFSFFILALESAMLGVFVSVDLFLFYIFWDAMLIPMYFLIGIWGYERRIYAAVKFILYTMAGSVLMLIAIIALAVAHNSATGSPSFNLLDLYSLNLSDTFQWYAFLAFALAFAIKVPLFPFHTWLPDAHVEAPTAGSIILAGVLLKMGTYGLLRFAFPLFPRRRPISHPTSRRWPVIGIIYGALVAMVQPDMKKLVAYSSVSHLGVVVLGLCAMNVQGVQGLGDADAEPRHQHGRALHDRRHALGSPPHPAHLRVRRAQGGDAEAGRGLPDHHAGVDCAAVHQRVRRRVPDLRRRLPLEPEADGVRRHRRDPVGPSTCCGCSSASTTGRSAMSTTARCPT